MNSEIRFGYHNLFFLVNITHQYCPILDSWSPGNLVIFCGFETIIAFCSNMWGVTWKYFAAQQRYFIYSLIFRVLGFEEKTKRGLTRNECLSEYLFPLHVFISNNNDNGVFPPAAGLTPTLHSLNGSVSLTRLHWLCIWYCNHKPVSSFLMCGLSLVLYCGSLFIASYGFIYVWTVTPTNYSPFESWVKASQSLWGVSSSKPPLLLPAHMAVQVVANIFTKVWGWLVQVNIQPELTALHSRFQG